MTQKNRTDLHTEISANVNDNSAGDITAADVRNALQDIADSNYNIMSDGYVVHSVTADSTLSINNSDPTNPGVALNTGYSNSWSVGQNFTSLLNTYSVGTPYSFYNSLTNDGSGLYAAGYSYSYNVYAYMDCPLGRVFDAAGANTSFSDYNDSDYYRFDLTWSGYGNESGFIIYDNNNNQYIDVGNCTSYSIYSYTSWTGGAPGLSPTSLSDATDAIKINPGSDLTADIALFGFSTSDYGLKWNAAGGYLQFSSPSNSLLTLHSNISSDNIYGGYIGGYFYGYNFGYTYGPNYGTWYGSTITSSYGGTGLSSYAQGDLIYYNSGTALSKLAKNATASRYLSNTGTSNNPAWAQINLTNGVTGVLPVANGGTGSSTAASYTSTQLLFGNGTSAPAQDTYLTYSGYTFSAPYINATQYTGSWTGSAIAPGYGGTGFSTYSTGDILYANTGLTLAKLNKNTTATRYLANTGTSNIPKWDQINLTNGVTGTLPTANGGTGGTAFTAGSILFAGSSTLSQDNANFFWDSTNKRLGIGTLSPSAFLDLPASTTTNAPLRMRVGTAPTSPNDGDMWYDGANLKFRVGGTTKIVTLT